MATRNGKIANLPNEIREQLNLRLLEGETGRELAAWLNALPAVQSILGSQFNGSDISEVNLTHWRQGGYLQWLTERECFDSARALAEGDCDLAEIGFSAERLLNVLTVRYGQLLMRWDLSPDDNAESHDCDMLVVPRLREKEASAFTEMARKARILQGISRAVLAIHRIQSRSACIKADAANSSASARIEPKNGARPSPTPVGRGKEENLPPDLAREGQLPRIRISAPSLSPSPTHSSSFPVSNLRTPVSAEPSRKILSGPITPSDVTHTPFKADPESSEALQAV
jgi:hypothetical protein